MLQRVVRKVVQLAVAGFVHGARQCSGAHPVVTANGAQVHNFSEQHAVPFGKHALVSKCCCIVVGMWQSRSLYVARLLESGDVRKRCSEGNKPNWRAYSCWFNVRTWGRSPNKRQAHKRIHVVRTFEKEAKIALKFTVIGGVQHVKIVAPAARFDCFHDRTNGFVNQFILYVGVSIYFAHLVGGQCCRHPF